MKGPFSSIYIYTPKYSSFLDNLPLYMKHKENFQPLDHISYGMFVSKERISWKIPTLATFSKLDN